MRYRLRGRRRIVSPTLPPTCLRSLVHGSVLMIVTSSGWSCMDRAYSAKFTRHLLKAAARFTITGLEVASSSPVHFFSAFGESAVVANRSLNIATPGAQFVTAMCASALTNLRGVLILIVEESLAFLRSAKSEEIVSITVVSCPRCHDEVGFGAPYCPHCGRDMMEHTPVERKKKTKPDTRLWAVAILDAAIIGVGAAVAFALIDAGLFAYNFRWGFGVWTASLVILVFAMSEHVIPSSTENLRPGHAFGGRSGTVLIHTRTWVPPSPVRALIIESQLLLAIGIVALLEGQIPI